MATHDENPGKYHEDMMDRVTEAFEIAEKVVCPHCRLVLKNRYGKFGPDILSPADSPVGFTFRSGNDFEILSDQSKSRVISYGITILPEPARPANVSCS